MDFLTSKVLHGITGRVSPGGPNGKLSVLCYHRVMPMADPLHPFDVDRESFAWQMRILVEHFDVLPLSEAVVRLRKGTLPARAASITFDDGYADNVQVALPILLRNNLSATFFIATGFLNGGRMWNDSVIEAIRLTQQDRLDLSPIGLGTIAVGSVEERRLAISKILKYLKYLEPAERQAKIREIERIVSVALPTDLMMRYQDVKELASAGMEIGGHTVSHPILINLPSGEAEKEIAEGKEKLEEISGAPVKMFAYPNGKKGEDYADEHIGMVRKLGFIGAASTSPGVSRRGDSGYELRRFIPWDSTPRRFLLRLLLNCTK